MIEVDDDTLNLFERAEKFGVRLSSKPVEEFEQEVSFVDSEWDFFFFISFFLFFIFFIFLELKINISGGS